jgi:hypothetical protein
MPHKFLAIACTMDESFDLISPDAANQLAGISGPCMMLRNHQASSILRCCKWTMSRPSIAPTWDCIVPLIFLGRPTFYWAIVGNGADN